MATRAPSRQPQATKRNAAPGESRLHALTHNRAAVLTAGVLASIVAAVLVWVAMRAVPRIFEQMPVEQVVFVGDLNEVERADLNALAEGLRTRNTSMLKLDLVELRDVVNQIHWVRDAQIRRRFPHTIEITIEEQRAAALWQAAGVSAGVSASDESKLRTMVNSYGEVFSAPLDVARDAVLPRLSGPGGTSTEVLEKFVALAAQLKPIDRAPRALGLSERRSWQTTLDNGTVLALGRQDADGRIARFVRASNSIPALQVGALQVDLRYPNGLAIKSLQEKPTAVTAQPKPSRRRT